MSDTPDKRKPVGAEDRLVREMLNHGGNRVWVQEDVEEWRDLVEFSRDRLHEWNNGAREDAAFVRERRLTWTRRNTNNGKLLWVAITALATFVTSVGVAFIVTKIHG